MVTAVWQDRVPSRWRGRLFGIVNSLAAAFGIATGLGIAGYLGRDVGRYPLVVAALALAVLLGAAAALRLPATRLQRSVRNPIRLLGVLVKHRTFGYLNVAWMLLGFGNLSVIPLRMEYVASSQSGLAYSARDVLFLTVVIPQATALVASVIWGRLFDRVDFLVLRVALNVVFMSSIVLFFLPALSHQVLGSLVYGIGVGGGAVQWNLWVTKYAPRGRTADYMAVHTFLTGIRGLVAPFLAYALLAGFSLSVAIWYCQVMLGASTVMVVALLLRERGTFAR
jgi:MFS family permease